jgi:hypothetical protein
MPETSAATAASLAIHLRPVARYEDIRALAWDGDVLYASRGYQLVRKKVNAHRTPGPSGEQTGPWEPVASFDPAWWRHLTSRTKPSSRLFRDGFHALAILRNRTNEQTSEPTLVGAVPGAIVTRLPGSHEFKVTHQIRRGTRPLHITAVPSGKIYWGEYFDNRERADVHIFRSSDHGQTWQVAYTFPARSIRHIHNIVYDQLSDCLWILTGDEGDECRILRASCDLSSIETICAGNQQSRAVAAIPMPDALYLSTDTPYEMNHVFCLMRANRQNAKLNQAQNIEQLAALSSSSIYGCRVGEAIFFSTMVEPSAANTNREVHIVGSIDKTDWPVLARWRKDRLPMRYFQYGNAFLPDGNNATNYLAVTTVAVEHDDLVTTLWEVESYPNSPARKPPLP